MKQSSTILLIFFSVIALAQKHKYVSKNSDTPLSELLHYSRQAGRLERIKNDSLGVTMYRTDNTEMILCEDLFTFFSVDKDKTAEELKNYLLTDSLITLLFKNGLLTSDMLLTAFKAKQKFISRTGDTLDFSFPQYPKRFTIYKFQQIIPPKGHKARGKRTICFEGFVDINQRDRFVLFLDSNTQPGQNNLIEYLKKAKIKYLRYEEWTFLDE